MPADTLVHFDTPVTGTDGLAYDASVCGIGAEDGLWDGWIEFRRIGGDAAWLCSPRETRQPDRGALLYWAGGLTLAYLEGALTRALRDEVSPEGAEHRPAATSDTSGRAEHGRGAEHTDRPAAIPVARESNAAARRSTGKREVPREAEEGPAA